MILNLKKIIKLASIAATTSATLFCGDFGFGFLNVHHAEDLQNAANEARWGTSYSIPRYVMVYDVDVLEYPVTVKDYSTPYPYKDVNRGTVAHIMAVDASPAAAPAFYHALEAAFLRHRGYTGRKAPAANTVWTDDSTSVLGITDDWNTVLAIRDNDGNSFLNVLAEYDNVRGLQACLALGMPVNKLHAPLGAFGNTPLCTAAAGRSDQFLREAITRLGAGADAALNTPSGGAYGGTAKKPMQLAQDKLAETNDPRYNDTIAIIAAAGGTA